MPNHVTNILTLSGDAVEIEKVRDLLRTTNQDGELTNVSFGTVCPMPKELIGTVSGSEGAKPEWQKENAAKLIEEYGAAEWYSWCSANWGTKWDAYRVGEWEDDTIKFETAWSPPVIVINKLSIMFPKVCINLKSADEGCGFVCNVDWECGCMIRDETYCSGEAFLNLMYDITGRDIKAEEAEYEREQEENEQ